MIFETRIGEHRIAGIAEYYGPTHSPATFPGYTPEGIARNLSWLAPHWYVPAMDKLVIAITLWVVRRGDRVVLVDTGYGNHKPRGVPHANMLNTLTMAWLEAAGATPDTVTDVVATHLHSDHVGWNTRAQDGGWVPTFPKARYHFPRPDFAFFEAEFNQVPSPRRAAGFGDSVKPVMEAGLGGLYDAGDMLPGDLRAEAAHGHTPGMMALWFGEGGAQGVFAADILHHPVQVAEPSWNSPADVDNDAARALRAGFIERVADTGITVFTCHFAPPGCGTIVRRDGGYAFVPAEARP